MNEYEADIGMMLHVGDLIIRMNSCSGNTAAETYFEQISEAQFSKSKTTYPH